MYTLQWLDWGTQNAIKNNIQFKATPSIEVGIRPS
jgi:hypothetical protein